MDRIRKDLNRYIPIKDDDNILYTRNESNGSKMMVSRKHPELQQLKYNKTMLLILENCDGKKSISDIIEILTKKYSNAEKSMITEDVMNSLHVLWRLGFVSWDNNRHAFRELYESTIDEYRACMLNEDQTAKWMRESSYKYIIPLNIVEATYTETAIKQNSFSFYETFFQLTKEGREVLTISLIIPVARECFYKIGIMNYDMQLIEKEVVNRFIKWATEKHQGLNLMSSHANSIVVYTETEDVENEDFIEQILEAKKAGCLQSELNNGADVNVFQMMI